MVSHITRTTLAICCMLSPDVMNSQMASSNDCTAPMSPGMMSSSMLPSMSRISGPRSSNASPSRSNTRTRIGPTLSSTASMDVTRLSVTLSKSALGSASATRKFCHAAFMVAMEPCTVDAASLLDVPVSFRFSCTLWMAMMMSANVTPSRLSSTVRPRSPASLMSLAISAAVPP